MIPYSVLFYQRNVPANRFVAMLGDTPPLPTGGGGGYQLVTLPKRAAVTVWQARDQLYTMPILIVLGGMPHPPPGCSTVAEAKEALETMWRPTNDAAPPPPIRIQSPGSIVPYQSLPWVVQDVQWSDGAADRKADPQVQKVTITLLEYRPDERLKATKVTPRLPRWGGRWKPGAFGSATTVTVKHGDTLATIAATLGVTWRDLGDAQKPPIHDPRKVTVGQVLRIPSASNTG
jgi:hypothetical protein